MKTTSQNWTLRFIPLWVGQALSLLGSQLVQFAIIWYLTQETNSATTLAIASMMGLLPQVLLSPFIGTWVDRGNRRLILIAADLTVAVATLVLAVLFRDLGIIQVWHIYIALFVRVVAGGFHQSAFGASVVLLVPKEHLARMQGFNQALYGGLNIISAPLGAYLLSVLPMQGILGIDVGTALLAITILLFIPIPQPERSAQTPSTFWQDFRAGFRYILAWRGLVILLGLVMVINFFYSATEPLTPLLITNHFPRWSRTAWLVAVLLCSGHHPWRIDPRCMGWIQTQGRHCTTWVNSHGLEHSSRGHCPIRPVLGWVVSKFGGGFVVAHHQWFVWSNITGGIAPEMQGRVFAFIFSAAMLVSPLALMVAGPFADAFGLQLWFLIAGISCVLMGLFGFFSSEVMDMENKSKEDASHVAAEPS